MQFANDITPLTLASTARLRDVLSSPYILDKLDDKEIEEIWDEIDSRSTLIKAYDSVGNLVPFRVYH